MKTKQEMINVLYSLLSEAVINDQPFKADIAFKLCAEWNEKASRSNVIEIGETPTGYYINDDIIEPQYFINNQVESVELI